MHLIQITLSLVTTGRSALSRIIVALGLILVINALFKRGQGLDRWSIRGIIFVLGSALLFGWTIRPLGLIVAGWLVYDGLCRSPLGRHDGWLALVGFVLIAAGINISTRGNAGRRPPAGVRP